MTAISCNPFSDDRRFLLCFQVVLFSDGIQTSSSKLYHAMSFYDLQVSFQQIYYAFAQKPDKLFWAGLKKVTFAFAGKQLEHLESRGILCVHRPKTVYALNVREYKILMEQFHRLCNNVIYRLSAVNQQMTKRNRRCLSIPVN